MPELTHGARFVLALLLCLVRATSPEPEIGWIVGWVERGDNTYLFALNIDIAKPEHVVARLDIAKSVLSDLGALP